VAVLQHNEGLIILWTQWQQTEKCKFRMLIIEADIKKHSEYS